jgi:hypothetical protein
VVALVLKFEGLHSGRRPSSDCSWSGDSERWEGAFSLSLSWALMVVSVVWGRKSIYGCRGGGKRERSLRNGQARGMIEEKAEEEQEGGGRLYMSSWVARALLLLSCRGK